MTAECRNCPMNEKCICNPSFDECSVRKDSYNKAIDEFVKRIKEPLNDFTKNGNMSVDIDYENAISLIDIIAKQLKR